MDPRVKTVMVAMQRLLGEQISLLTLSRTVNLSPSRLRQIFKSATGESPRQYLRDLRMRNAENLLRNTFLTVKEVAFASGIGDVSSFVRVFKKRYGLTPSKFRARNEALLNVATKVDRNGE